MTFEWALSELKAGRRVRPESWHHNGWRLELLGASGIAGLSQGPDGAMLVRLDEMGKPISGWSPSTGDLLRDDWEAVPTDG